MKPFLLSLLALVLSVAELSAADFDIRIPSEFHKIVPANAELKKLATGMKFTEGPVWVSRDGGYLLFSDIYAEEMKKWSARDGLTLYRTNTHLGNGNCLDRQGRLLSCEGGARRVIRMELDGSVHPIAEQYEGKKLNAPNDVVVKSDDTIWFSDPDYGLTKPKEVPGMYVYRLEPGTGKMSVVVQDCDHPNGLCFSPDEKRLYVADSAMSKHEIHVYDVQKDGTLMNGKIFCVIDKGLPDGIRCDATGRVFSSAGDGVQIFNPQGELIGKILVPQTPANIGFGGKNHKTLFITAQSSLYSMEVSVKGDK